MFTKPLTRHSVTTVDVSKDADSISRLLVAAAINPNFCSRLLANPHQALQSGFGGEGFPMSGSTLNAVMSIRASTLSELALKLNEILSNHSRPS